ncbi:hypothetical protein LSP22_16720 [Pseudomonas aeruginosa]|uniref:hypothetical protein n=1 Tax=Pseudomonas aeruginosa TaxID=287 RepID=UPI001E643C29|nr:hypothetical protein [Pseudomonas aeruginosa]MBN5481456.1 hypothetical protein [Pseudomonas aeruginosa]MCO3466225.1 hypothetical protein [Pseudomonas aeruginosa]MCO3477276.1 hypothetical protein [Pseudomonas aeruginosa]UGR36678.1 hypothetical protein LSP22_16720 [Pseudomonas aeruginosa]HCW0214219.1 hypothetical protein [Pseudomonas aeruginosa]
MTRKNTGLLVRFDESRRADLIKGKIGEGFEAFSDALSVTDWDVGQLSTALLSFSASTIDYISLAKKGNQVVTSKNRVEFSSILDVESIEISEIEAILPAVMQRYFIRASQGIGGAIPSKTWVETMEAVKVLRPHLVSEIDRVLSLQRFSGMRFHGSVAEVQIQEREALGISLDIFSGNNKLRSRVLSEWAPPAEAVFDLDEENQSATLRALPSSGPSFLSGISKRYIQEETAIQHDLYTWPGSAPVHAGGISVFEQGGRKLSVIYANRNALEHTLGVDLIYYNEPFELFVLVQYKLMNDEGGVMTYRPDSQLSAELARMDAFSQAVKSQAPLTSHKAHRLSDDGFMMKMVPNTGLMPASGELIRGMYLSREYMNFLISPAGPKGPRGGSQITFESAPRYLTNTEFSSLIHSGWIGTRGVGTRMIKGIIQSYYSKGRALLISHETSK